MALYRVDKGTVLRKMAYFSRRALILAKDRTVLTLPRRSLSYPREPLNQPVSELSVPSASSTVQRHHIDKASLAEVRVTELENGLRVASQEAFGQYSNIGGRHMVAFFFLMRHAVGVL